MTRRASTGPRADPAPDLGVLIVDDDRISVMAAERAMDRLNLRYRTRVAMDGVQALEVLRGADGRPSLDAPFVVLLDINMPRMDGHEFLAEIRGDPLLRQTLVFVLTSSDAPGDISRAYDRNVAGYFLKGESFADIVAGIGVIDHYLSTVIVPGAR